MSEWMSEGQWDGKKEGERTRGSQSQQLHLSHTALWIPAVGLSLLTCALYCRTKIKPAQNTSDSSTAERAPWCKCTAGTWSFRWLVSLKIKKELSNSVTNTHSSSWRMYEIRAAFCMTHSVLTVLARQLIINVIMYPCNIDGSVGYLALFKSDDYNTGLLYPVMSCFGMAHPGHVTSPSQG